MCSYPLLRILQKIVLRDARRPADLVAVGVNDLKANRVTVSAFDRVEAVAVRSGYVLADQVVDVVVCHPAIVGRTPQVAFSSLGGRRHRA